MGHECPPSTPLFLSLARDCRRSRILDLQPAVRATGAVRGSQPLRDDALATERASLTVDDRAIRDEVRVERDARMLAAQQRLQGALAGFDRLAPQVFAVELDEIEGA